MDLGEGAARHDAMYRSAAGDLARLPWPAGRVGAALVSWLNAEAPGRIRPGSRAVVVGCGLGDDVIELLNRGYDAIGFDISPAAVDWARSRFPAQASAFCVCDLHAPPTRFRHRFDLVVECGTLETIEPAARERATEALVSLLSPRGTMTVVARGRDGNASGESSDVISCVELAGLMESAGLKPIRPLDDFTDGDGVRRIRGVFERA